MERQNSIVKAVALLFLLVLLVTACKSNSAPIPTTDLAGTAAVQTVAAMPTSTQEPSPTMLPSATRRPTSTPTLIPTITPTPTVTLTPTPTRVVLGPTGFPNNVDPLTGLVVSDPKLLDRRPIMIKVANYPREDGRPHAGLSAADIVFDYYIGEGANRFLALYYGQDSSKVGSVRSGRLVDAQLVPMYQGILGFEYAWGPIYQKIVNALGRRAITGGPATCPALCDDGRRSPEGLPLVTGYFADTAKLSAYATSKGVDNTRQNLDGMAFDSRPPATGKPAIDVMIEMTYRNLGEWKFDQASGTYLRWIENVDAKDNLTMIPLVDRNTGKQLAFNNVVIIFTTYTQFAPAYHEIAVATSTTYKPAYLFRDGLMVQGLWKSVGINKPIQFFTQDRQPLDFKPGNSWIVLAGDNSVVKETASGNWHMTFGLP
jgi:hypothetical protein